MSPKLVTVHLFRPGKVLEDPADQILLNPRRVDAFIPEPPPTAYPGTYWGTRVRLGSNKHLVIRETIAEIKRLLK